VVVISLPCTSGIKPGWIVYALRRGFDGVFVAADGEECGYLADCSARFAAIVARAQQLTAEAGIDGRRLKMAAICSVCAEPFARQVRRRPVDYDVLVTGSGIGIGIGGMESALKLGDMGYRVLVVEKEPSIGGKMIHLAKVFPTLDCASCIATPKMAATAHHPNITVATLANITRIARQPDGSFRATVHHQPRFIDEAGPDPAAQAVRRRP
jgi:heterodisulfide reductase subunit A-like polyferredoxin